jgi:hypothetical protein
MNLKKKKIYFFPALVLIALLMSSCQATMHTVGTGGRGNCKDVGQYDAKKKQWYWLWGAVPINHVDSKDMAGGAQNYTIRTTHSLGDLLLSGIAGYAGFSVQTIRVSKGDK